MTTAASIVLRAQTALQDASGVRWPATELVGHLNDGQRELSRLRPDLTAALRTLTLVEGFYHALPAEYAALISIPNNTTGTRKRITKVDLMQLDAVDPAWRNKTPAATVLHFMHDMRDPRSFYVYPPVAAGTQVTAAVSEYPTDVPAPTGATSTTVSGNVAFTDQWADALLNFVLYKAYSKDAEFGGNAQLAASYLGLFNAAVGSQLQSATAVASKT